MKALIFQEAVVQVQETTFEVNPALFWIDCPDDCVPGWTYINGVLAPPVVPTPTIPEVIAQYNAAVQAHLDEVAAQKSYESSLSCVTYVTSTVTEWSAESVVFSAWRDAVWVYVLGELPKFISGERPLIPVDQFIAELPTITW